MRPTTAILLCSLSSAPACHRDVQPPAEAPTPAKIEASYDDAEIRKDAAALADELKIDRTQRADLLGKLDNLLADPKFRAAKEKNPVRAVGVYHWGEGGLIVNVGRGSGRMRVAGSDTELPFVLKSLGVGAQAGGTDHSGVVLALGLQSETALEGKYAGNVAGATAGQETAGAMSLKHRRRAHTLWLVDVAEGLSANAGREGFELSFGAPSK